MPKSSHVVVLFYIAVAALLVSLPQPTLAKEPTSPGYAQSEGRLLQLESRVDRLESRLNRLEGVVTDLALSVSKLVTVSENTLAAVERQRQTPASNVSRYEPPLRFVAHQIEPERSHSGYGGETGRVDIRTFGNGTVHVALPGGGSITSGIQGVQLRDDSVSDWTPTFANSGASPPYYLKRAALKAAGYYPTAYQPPIPIAPAGIWR